MALKVYNTMARRKEDFEPIDPPGVGMYVCGVTAYDLSHIGHARSAIAFDVIYRYLMYAGYDVTYVRNFTDIDDKIIRRAGELGVPTSELAEKYINAFTEDMAALDLKVPAVEPRCTDYVPRMVEFIEKLVEKGYAYPAPSGDVFYRVSRFEGYGKLSKKNLEDLEAGARVEVNEEKESPLDFVLWKAAKPGEPKWTSPWGEGRPGWHIECSVMSTENLSETLDIHGGGKDLVFPHHENEIAQSEAVTGKPYASYWLHNGFVNAPGGDGPEGTKMSKSLGNFYTVRDVLAAFHPQAIKFFMLSTHYRNDLLFTEDGLNRAQSRLAYFYDTLDKAAAFIAGNSGDEGELVEKDQVEGLIGDFTAAMDDDFNTQRAFGRLAGVFKLMNELVSGDGREAADTAATLARLRKDLAAVAGVLGVFDLDPKRFGRELKEMRARQIGISVEDIEGLIKDRTDARNNKDWARADEIRDELMVRGVIIKDDRSGTSWTIKS